MIRKNINAHDAIIFGKKYENKRYLIVNEFRNYFKNFSCSFDCFKKHKDVDCAPAKTETAEKSEKIEDVRKPILQFTTEDTVDPDKLAQLGINCR